MIKFIRSFLRADSRAKLTLATLAELWREGWMQSLGHHSTSLFCFFFFLSQVFLFFRAAGSIHFITDTLKSEATSPLFYVFFFTFQDELEATLKQWADHSVLGEKVFGIPSEPSAPPGQFLTSSSSTAAHCHFLKGEVLQLLSAESVQGDNVQVMDPHSQTTRQRKNNPYQFITLMVCACISKTFILFQSTDRSK